MIATQLVRVEMVLILRSALAHFWKLYLHREIIVNTVVISGKRNAAEHRYLLIKVCVGNLMWRCTNPPARKARLLLVDLPGGSCGIFSGYHCTAWDKVTGKYSGGSKGK